MFCTGDTAAQRPVPSSNVVKRSIATPAHSSDPPPGQTTRTVTGTLAVAQPHEDPRVVRGGIAAIGPHAPPEGAAIREHDRNTRTEHVASPLPAHQPHTHPVAALASLVDEELHRAVVVADEHVDVAVVVHVAKGGAAAHHGQLEGGAGGAR